MHLVDELYLDPLNPVIDPAGCTATHRRMLRLAGPALAEALAPGGPPLPLLLALPEVPVDGRDPVGDSFIAQLSVQAGVKLDERKSTTYRQGGAGALYALSDALALLAGGSVSQVAVGGVDTFLDLRRLGWLDAQGRIHGFYSRLGFFPGEGAGILLLRASSPGRSLSAQPQAMARVLGVGTGNERGHRYSKEPYRGDGLSEAFDALFAVVPEREPRVRCVYAGFNGEEMAAKEWGVAQIRHAERFAGELQVEHPADCIGDAGAALGAIMLGLAAVEVSRAHAHLPGAGPTGGVDDPGPCLVWCTSDREARAAALLLR